MKVNTNIPALKVLNQLTKTNLGLDRSIEKLSSGKRINRAADDAAGLAISEKMRTQINGLATANRNSMDGISLIQTAEGALVEVHSMLHRARELAIQASNGTLGSDDRATISAEISQLKSEIERISKTTEYNGLPLLNGSVDRKTFPTDTDAASLISMSDSVQAADYTFQISEAAKKTEDTGNVVTLFDADGKATTGGTININGEQVVIERGDTSEKVFEKLRNLSNLVSVDLTTRQPFENGSRLTLTAQEYGEKKIEVEGDTALLRLLGLDSQSFNPNSTDAYMSTSTASFTAGSNGTVYINNVEISFLAADTTTDIFNKLKQANIPGVDIALSAGKLSIVSQKPLAIDSKTSADDTLRDNLISQLVAGATALPDTATKSATGKTMDTTTNLTASNIQIVVNGANVGAPISVPSGPLDINALITNLNGMGVPNTTFMMESGKLVAYNTNGDKITIEASGADLSAVNAIGFTDKEVGLQKNLGNLGNDVKVDLNSVVFDISGTAEIEGFPAGTTVSTEGSKIKFTGPSGFELIIENNQKVGNVTMHILESGPLTLQIGANEGQTMEIRIQNLSPKALGIEDVKMGTIEYAEEAIGKIDKAIEIVSVIRSKLGAFQNRLEHTVNSLTTANENMTAALSRIEDVDMAAEMAEYTRANVLAQAGVSILAHANQRPQSILQLLNN